jgi:hypothetical protein
VGVDEEEEEVEEEVLEIVEIVEIVEKFDDFEDFDDFELENGEVVLGLGQDGVEESWKWAWITELLPCCSARGSPWSAEFMMFSRWSRRSRNRVLQANCLERVGNCARGSTRGLAKRF